MNSGCSAMQDTHQDAKTLTNETWPFRSVVFRPFCRSGRAGKSNCGAFFPMRTDGISLGLRPNPTNKNPPITRAITMGINLGQKDLGPSSVFVSILVPIISHLPPLARRFFAYDRLHDGPHLHDACRCRRRQITRLRPFVRPSSSPPARRSTGRSISAGRARGPPARRRRPRGST